MGLTVPIIGAVADQISCDQKRHMPGSMVFVK
jgi:hypothetical protein